MNYQPYLILLMLGLSCSGPSDFPLGGDAGASIFVSPTAAPYLRLAAEDLAGDVEKITGQRPTITADRAACAPCIALALDTSSTEHPERFRVDITGQEVTIRGTSDRALMHGVYYLSEHQLGVDPLYFWSGLEPERRDDLTLAPMSYDSEEPDFDFRGWFINDEDLLTEWMDSGGKRNIRYRYYGDVVNPEAMAHVVEAAVRLRFNLIIPASFLDIGNPPEKALVDEAARRGLYLSMHHIEPLGVSAFTYENYWAERGEEPLFSYYSEPDKVEEVWRHYAGLWAEYPDVIWQVGLRGFGDRPMWMADPGVPQSDADRAGIISDAMALQRDIVTEVTGEAQPLMTTTLWAEGSYFNERGLLDIPEDVITVFADNNSGWYWQADFYDTEREAGRKYGVYYHHQLWGWGPHLAQAIPPWQTGKVMREAYTHGASDYAIMNVSNIREFLPGLAASAEMLWSMDEFDGHDFLARWSDTRFAGAADAVTEAYTVYYDGYALFGEQQMPGFLDGQSKYKGEGILRSIERIAREGYTPPAPRTASKNGQPDPFHAALGGASGVGGTPADTLLYRLREQLAAFERADSLTGLALTQLDGTERQLLADNLQTHIRIQLAIGRWLEAVMQAEAAAQENDLATAAELLDRAERELATAADAKATAAHGKWELWYRGDRKMNLPGLRERTAEVARQLTLSR